MHQSRMIMKNLQLREKKIINFVFEITTSTAKYIVWVNIMVK